MTNLLHFQTNIDGKWCSALSGETFETSNPFTGSPWATLPRCNANDVNVAVAAARRTFETGPWPAMSASDRGRLLLRLAALAARDADLLAEIEVRDNGKLLAEMRGQMQYAVRWWEYFGGLADKIEGGVLPIDKPDYFTFTLREPLGPIAIITPWNSPLMLATWKMAPALAAGNTVVWKPSEFTSASAVHFMRLIEEAGFPDGVVNLVTGLGQDVGERLVTHPDIAKVAFTGGDSTGERVYTAAARGLKPAVMELGGKSANIVFADAVLDDAVKGAVAGIFAASGQTCIAGSRLLLHRSIHDEFVEKLVAFAGQARIGDPMSLDTQVGPITTPAQYRKVLDYISIAKREGAKVVLGGGPAQVDGSTSTSFVQPTILTNVHNGMRIAQEEVFGPVLSVIPFDEEADAIKIANDSLFGLAAGVWTADTKRMLRMARHLHVGTVWINTYRAISFMAPFGGQGRSGFGRENGQHAIDEFLQAKSVWIHVGDETPNPFAMR